MIELFNRFRFLVLSAHHHLLAAVKANLSWQNAARVMGTLLLLWQTNLLGVRQGVRRQQEANWNGADFLLIDDEVLAGIDRLAEDSGAVVEIYAINYRLPGFYEGVRSSSGHTPKDRYLSRDLLWQELQRSECISSDRFADLTDLRSEFEIYCPINNGLLSLPVGFISMRWRGFRPQPQQIEGYTDRLFDVGRLVSR